MFPVSSSVPNLPNVRFPNVCPEPLKPKSSFCIEHYSKAQTLGYPTDVKGFLSYCGAAKTAGISLVFRFEDYGLYPAKRDSKISCPQCSGKLDDSDGSQEEIEVEEGEDMIFDDAVKQIAATSSVTSDAMLVSQGVFLVYHMHASFSLFLHNVLNFLQVLQTLCSSFHQWLIAVSLSHLTKSPLAERI